MDRLVSLATFVAVCDRSGFTAAARRLGVSPSVVTRRIADLEQRLGVRLLTRTTRAVALTEPGRAYLERARIILDQIAEADAEVARERAAPTGQLVVAAPVLFGRLHVAPLVAKYLARHPGVTAQLLLNDRVINLVEEGIDAAVRIGALRDSSLVARALGATRRVVVGAPRYLARHGRPRVPEDLADHAVTLFTSFTGVSEWRFERDGAERVVRLAPRFFTNNGDAAIDHVIAGGGLTRTLAYQVAESVRAGALDIVLEDWEPPPAPINVVYPSSRLLSAKVRAFVDLLAAEARWSFVDLSAGATRRRARSGRSTRG